MPEYRRGAAAIKEAAASGGGKGFRNFAPEIFWKEDGEKKHVLVLTPIDEIWAFDLHDFIPVEHEKTDGTTYTTNESFLSRKDPYIGEDYDKIEDDLGRSPKRRCLGVAVELEPVMEVVKGRKRPTGFSVKTNTFTKNTDDGEQEITYPVIGFITQSSALMWSPLASLDESQGPLSELPLEVVRRIPGGKKSNTRYEFVPFMDIPVDLSAVIDNVDGISYLGDSLEDLVSELESVGDNDLEGAQVVARALVDRRVAELADGERYEELVGPIDELPALPWESKKESSRSLRPSRPTQRKRPAETDDEESSEAEESQPPKEDRFARLKAQIEKSG